jgi:hypothetical protein
VTTSELLNSRTLLGFAILGSISLSFGGSILVGKTNLIICLILKADAVI